MSDKIKIAIADDHTLVCESFARSLLDDPSFEVVGTAPNGLLLLQIIEQKNPDIILLDLEMPVMNGWETMAYIRSHELKCKIVIVSMHYENLHIKDMVSLGARGFLPKEADFKTLMLAIHEVHNSGYYFNKDISKRVVKDLITTRAINPVFSAVALSERELFTLQMVCSAKLNWEIAEELKVSERQVDRYKTALLEKSQAKTTAGLVLFALRNNYISI